MARKLRHPQAALRLALVSILPVLFSPAFGSVIYVDGITDALFVGGSAGNGLVDGYDSTNAALPRTFNTNYLGVPGDGTQFFSTPQLFSNVGYTTIGSARYFAFVLDAQETSGNEMFQIDSVRIGVTGNSDVWHTTDTIVVNSPNVPKNPTNLTLTPLGNGADLALYVPVSAFDGLGLTGSSTFTFYATHSGGNNGNEEWRLTDEGVVRGTTGTVQRFGPNESIASEANSVPEPSPAVLFLTGIGVMALGRRLRRLRS